MRKIVFFSQFLQRCPAHLNRYVMTYHTQKLVEFFVFHTFSVYRCGRLEAPGSGSVLCNHTAHIVGTQCVLECNTGYTMGGSDIRTCQLNGDNTPYWDGQNTVCTSELGIPNSFIVCSSALETSSSVHHAWLTKGSLF